MIDRRVVFGVACLVGACAACAAQERFAVPEPPSAAAIAAAPSYAPDEAVVAAHYFYWYRWPDEHTFDGAGRVDTALRHHFPNHEAVSYKSKAWHAAQMRDMNDAGVDIALCVYWGAPNQYLKSDLKFSVLGLPPLVAALDDLAASGPAPRIALFYDTSTLLARHAFADARSGNVDLRTDEGKDIFYRTIRDFFRMVPPRHWACLDGRPIVQFYNSTFAAGHDQSTLDYARERFAKDFHGVSPYFVAGPSWSFSADASTGWGAALNGPLLGEDVAQVGAGYDDSPVPGRQTPTRDRLGGGYYEASWLLAIQRQPRLVIIETWNELHEGTGVCESIEDGRFYIDLTRRFSGMLKSGRQPEGDAWALALQEVLNGRPSKSTGREFASLIALSYGVAGDGEPVEKGLRLCSDVADGVCEITRIGGVDCLKTRPGPAPSQYLYFDVADPYYYDHRGVLTLRMTYLDAGRSPIAVEYDSIEETGSIFDRYRPHRRQIERAGTNSWKTVKLVLAGARCANRQNGGADLRLVSLGGDLAVSQLEISKLPDGYGR